MFSVVWAFDGVQVTLRREPPIGTMFWSRFAHRTSMEIVLNFHQGYGMVESHLDIRPNDVDIELSQESPVMPIPFTCPDCGLERR